MQIILLDEQRFNDFAINHPYSNFYQSSMYGNLMSKHGYNSYYLGLVDESNEIKAATLVIVKNEKNNKRKMGYAPRGFLIDWNNEEIVKEFTEKIKEYLSKRNFTYLKVDPKVIYKKHYLDGSVKDEFDTNTEFVRKLQKLGYVHMGYNNGLEANKPRWDSLTKLDSNTISLYNSISKEAREKITAAANSGIKIYKGDNNDINRFYQVINKENPPIDYYYDLYQFLGVNDGFDIYFAKLEPAIFVNSSKMLYEKEEALNNELNEKIQSFNVPNKEQIMNEKIKSDERLSIHKKNMVNAINLFQKNPNGIIVSGVAVIKYGKNITFFISGINDEYKNTYPEYLLDWQIMQKFSKLGYEKADFNGMTGSFNKEYNNTLEQELASDIVEYVGEFDLVINKKLYYTENKLNPIINWLNTPI